MRYSLRKSMAAIVVALALVAPTDTGAHEGATGVVKERMELMSRLGKSVKAISAMLRGKSHQDAATLRQAARTIAEQGGDRLTELFPEGSLQPPSAAQPAIWSSWRRFSDYADRMRSLAGALAMAADPPRKIRGDDSAARVFKRLTRTCRGCHREFRKPEH